MQLSEATRLRTREAGWSDTLVERFENSKLRDDQVLALLALNLNEERANRFLQLVEDNPEAPFGQLSLRWARPHTELGMRCRPGPNGLGMPEINVGTYGEVPDHWPYENDTPLGSHPTPGSYAPGSYSVYDKTEVWAEGVDHLYEQAIRERWVPATDIDWAALEPQAEVMERAICQICTSMAQHALAEQKVLSKWEERIAYGYHDVKIFLATQIFDAGRKFEALRKRAVANGGGFGQQGLGTLYRAWFGSLKSTEMIVAIDVVYKTYEVVLLEKLAEVAPLAVDRDLFAKLLRDSRRHLEFGTRHLKYYIQHHRDAREFLQFFLARAEAALSDELHHSRAEWEALVIILGEGVEKTQVGLQRLRQLREDQLRRYLETLDRLSVDRVISVNPGLLAIARDANRVVEVGQRIT